jgi:methyl-accepting chemotaxis protein
VAVEPISEASVAAWSELCGARVSLSETPDSGEGAFTKVARELGDVDLRVAVSLQAERNALENARRNLLTGGTIALALAFGASLLLARGLVRPIQEIQDVSEKISRSGMSPGHST